MQALDGGYTLCLYTNLLRKDLIESKKNAEKHRNNSTNGWCMGFY